MSSDYCQSSYSSVIPSPSSVDTYVRNDPRNDISVYIEFKLYHTIAGITFSTPVLYLGGTLENGSYTQEEVDEIAMEVVKDYVKNIPDLFDEVDNIVIIKTELR